MKIVLSTIFHAKIFTFFSRKKKKAKTTKLPYFHVSESFGYSSGLRNPKGVYRRSSPKYTESFIISTFPSVEKWSKINIRFDENIDLILTV